MLEKLVKVFWINLNVPFLRKLMSLEEIIGKSRKDPPPFW